MLLDEGPDPGDVETAGCGDALDLGDGIRRRDVGVQPAARCGERVGGSGRRVETRCPRALGDLGLEVSTGPEVGSTARVAGVVAGRGATVEPLVALPLLADEARADDPGSGRDERAGRLVASGDLADAPHRGGVEHAEQHGEDEHGPKAREGLLDDVVHVSHIIPGRWLTTRSISLMPMNGAMTPPTP